MSLLERLRKILFLRPNFLSGQGEFNPLDFGRLISNRYGKVVYIYRPIKINTQGHHLKEILYLSKESVSLLSTCNNFDNLNIKNILFLDIETLSLSPRFSNIILIGIAFYRGGKIHLEQFFTLSKEDELLALYIFKKRFRYFSYIVGYNVRNFDVNFIKKRSFINGLNIDFKGRDCIDMCVASRRFFKGRVPNFRLETIGSFLFNEERDDIPSSEIPLYWENFRRYKSPYYAKQIIEHNRIDLVCTIKLFIWFFSRMKRPFGYYFENNEDRESVLRLLEKYGEPQHIREYIRFVKRRKNISF